MNASKRKLDYSLTFKRVKKVLMTKRCYFTGVELSRIDGDPHQLSVDRIDNNVGYIDSNIVACSRSFNQDIKRNLTVEDIKTLYNGLKKAKLV